MTYLLDINLLVALAWPTHVHHGTALAWFRRNQASGWATCPLTQSGFVRVSSNSSVVSEARTPQEAIHLLRRIVALPHHIFWHDDLSLASSEFLDEVPLVGYRQVTDAHLLALAQRRGGILATLDGKIRGLVPRSHAAADVLCLVLDG
jgi:toxin-antitoxin system PIN domain toxin